MTKFKYLRLAKKNRETNPESFEQLYNYMVEQEIRKRYTVSQELAILRQQFRKPVEFAEYDAYVEQCKINVKQALDMQQYY